MIKVAFEYFRRKVEASGAALNPCVKCLLCAARCCIYILDCCVKYITKNAYIQVALTKKNFCSSAWAAFCLIVRNAGRFAIIEGIGFILMFVGKAFIVVLSCWIGYILCTETYLRNNLTSPIFPTLGCGIIGYLLGSIFLSVYSFASTAILHCFLLDEEIKGGHTPASLKDFIEVNDSMNHGCCSCCGGSSKPPAAANNANE